MKITKILLAAACATFASSTTTAFGAVSINISGGNGTPLSITTTEDIVFTNVTAGSIDYGFSIIGAAPGNTENSASIHTGSMIWSTGGSISGNAGMGSTTVGSIVLEDLFAYWTNNGNQSPSTSTMTLTAGTRTTFASVNGVYTQGVGNYDIRFFDSSLTYAGDAGNQVPEPGTYAALAGLAALGFVVWRRRVAKLKESK